MNVCFRNSHQRGFGTFPLTGEALHAAILTAAEAGYRAFDTAQMYRNEADTGEALQATGVPREALCITTKVHPDNYGEDRFIASVEQSLRDLRVDCVDVLLLHWPPVGGAVAPRLKLLRKALDAGLARNIGVSNYNVAMMRDALSIVDAPLVTNQVEFHPLLNQDQAARGRRRDAESRCRRTVRSPGARCSGTPSLPRSARATARPPARWCCAGSSRRG